MMPLEKPLPGQPWGLHSRLVLILIIALLPAFGFVVYGSIKSQNERLALARTNLQTVSQLSALGTERTVEGARQLLGVITSGPSLKGSGLNALCTEFLDNIRGAYPNYSLVGFLDTQGNVLCDTSRKSSHDNFADRPYFQSALATRSFAVGEYQVGRRSGHPSISFAMPVFDNQGTLKGLAAAGLDLTQRALELQVGIPAYFSVTLTDRNGTILATDTSQKGRIGTRYPDAALYNAMKAPQAGTTEATDPNGVEKLYSVVPVDVGGQPGLFIVSSVARDALVAPARRDLLVALLLFTLCAAVGIAVARWLGNKTLVTPTRHLLREIDQLADAYAAPATPSRQHADEIGALSSAFHRLASVVALRQAERDSKEAELQKSQDRLLIAQRMGKIGNWESDSATGWLFWSDQIYKILEQKRENFKVRVGTLADHIFPADRELFEQARRPFVAGHAALDIEHRIVTGTGKVRWVHTLGELRVDAEGQQLMSGTVQDITDRVRNERLLAAESLALKGLSLGMPLKAVLDEFMLGLEAVLPGAMASVNLLSDDGTLLKPLAGPSLPPAYAQALDGLPIGPSAGSCGTAAYRREPVVVSDIRSDPLWADYRELAQQHGLRACWSLPVQDPNGKVVATFAGTYRDAHVPNPEEMALAHGAADVIGIAIARDMSVAALRASEQRFKNTFAGAATGMAITTVQGIYIEVNAAYCHILGQSAQDLHGKDINNFIHPEDRAQQSVDLRELQEGKRDHYISVIRFLLEGSRIAWIRASVSALRDSSGQVTGVVRIAEDITLQRNAEEALRKTQQMLSMASRISRQGAWQVDLHSYQLTWSEEVYAIHELPLDQAPSVEDALQRAAPEYRDTLRAHFQNCVSRGLPYDAELQIITGRGQKLWVRIMGEAVRDASGTVVKVQGAIKDIDLQKQSELRERTIENRLATTLETISDAFFLLDHDWNFVFVNGRAARSFGGGRGNLVGKNLWREYPQIVGTIAEQQYRSTVSEQQTRSFDWFYPPGNVWYEFHAYPTPEGLGVYFQDVTQKRKAAEQLQLLQTAVANLNDVVMITEATRIDESGLNIVFVNDAFETMTGYNRDEVMGRSPRILQGAETSRVELDRIRLALDKGKSVRASLINYTKTGVAYWVEIEIVPITDAQRNLTHFVAIERDITERKAAEAQILQLNAELEDRVQRRTAQLEAANKELEAFSYSVSHDLRAPLNTINGFGQLLLKSNGPKLDDKGQHYLSRIRTGAEQMGELINGLLSLAKISRESLKLEMVDLSGIARQFERECRMRDPERVVDVVIQDGLLVRGDAVLLSVAMQNLFENAWKYSAKVKAAMIEFGSEAVPDRQTVYFVKDNGAGFDMAYADKLFGVFQRLHAPAEFSGTGVGLANVKRVIERHGGHVWAHAAPGEGAIFRFTLGAEPSSQGPETALSRGQQAPI
jgi:PAS domain S-box-containing protein